MAGLANNGEPLLGCWNLLQVLSGLEGHIRKEQFAGQRAGGPEFPETASRVLGRNSFWRFVMRKATPCGGDKVFVALTILTVAWAVLFGNSLLFGQSSMGAISGIVSDQSGGVVPNAKVELRNESTNVMANTESNNAGVYVFSNVLPGTYEVTVAASGFKSYVVRHIVVYVNQDVTENVKLSIGSVSISVQVQAKLPLVQTSSSSVGGVIDTKQIDMMPLNGRTNIFGLLELAPGVQMSGNEARMGGNSWANGTFATTDGAVSMEMENSRLSDVSPSLDSISEFKVVDSTGSAESGPGTTQVIIATKEGGNQFHGTAFEYNRVRALEAANYFATGIPKPQFIRNEFGGSLGGPIKHDKAFFFGSYEAFKFRSAATSQTAMPTQALLNGDFSGLPPVIDPQTGLPFPNNQIPTSRFSSVSKAFFPYFSAPNIPTSATAGLGVNYRVNLPSEQNNNRYQGRVDYNLNAKNIISGRYYIVRQSPYNSPGITEKFGGVSSPATNQNLAINYTRIISPSLVNLATFGWARETDQRYSLQNYGLQPSSLIPGLPASLPGLGGLPAISITGFTGFNDNYGSGDTIPTYQFNDVMTWVKGAHTVKGGFSWLRWQFLNYQNPPPGHGSFSFTGRYTGNPFADFLLGDLSSSARPVAGLKGSPTNDRFGMFIQDSWKKTSRLTINMGVRYDVATLFENTVGNMANYYPNLNEVVILKGQDTGLFPSLPIVSGSSVGINTGTYIGNDLNRISPRIGFAYSAMDNGRLVVRGGYGIYYDYMPWKFGSWWTALQPPWSGSESFEPQAGSTPTLTFADPFPTGAGSVPSAVSVYALPKNYQYPLTHEWNFTLESQLSNNMSVRATYLGTETQHAGQLFNLNDPVPAAGPVQPRRPYQPFGSINLLTNGETRNEQSLQLSAVRRFSSGLSFQVEYAWTKELLGSQYDLSAPTDNRNIRLDRGNSPFIRQQYAVANYVYNLPFGRGKQFLSTLSGPLNVILGGWSTSGIVTLASGLPYSVYFTSSVEGWPSSRADIVGNPSVSNPSINQWFNPAAYAVPQPFAYGNSAPNSLFGPGYTDWDMSLFKDFRLNERFRLQFRSDFFNTLNHPSFSNPASNISVPSQVGQIFSTSSDPRSIQFALRLSF